ncbi:2-oxoacid:acceptor oxidoreductase subunit alpha [Fundidesulfovibrio agrisoli]|uniref:2-oxoacid:acceptor oxidoreductase subunit alpha n=1 Tax=Fundidesulfovibrio agrisoli TaxID=2922717 RepID=UPI001FABF101|nr:2-oxoacid:acceptor oxidoreductase subunit alpha [Fundidesulfovibrio agrisoli]
MSDTCVSIVIGGEAGQGLVTVGDFLAKALVRAGYEIVVTQDYMSRIRGGHNTYAIRVSHEAIHGPRESIDLLVALNAETVALHRAQLTSRALVLADEAIDRLGHPGLSIPFKALCPKPMFENVAALGVLTQLLCLERSWLEALIRDEFAKKGDEVVRQNLDVFSSAQDWAAGQKAVFSCMAPPVRTAKRLFMNGNEAIAFGALAAGANFCSYYPMTPATSVAATFVSQGTKMGMLIEQAEDEIAAINMALGASYAGARVVVPTSGGGFALMVEGVSLAGMTETPVVVVLAQRPGPATGLPTRTEQGDLNMVLYAGHGDFPRAVFTPGTPEQCFELTYRAMDQAEKWQSPVFVLTDQFLADSYRAVVPFDLEALPPVSGPGLTCEDPAGYKRYALTPSGVSPRLVPGFGEHLVVVDSDEHTEDGHITEDLTVRVQMVDKRMRKFDGLAADVVPPTYSGDEAPSTLLVCWGSAMGAALEAAQGLRAGGKSAAVLHFGQVYPLIPKQFLPILERAGRVVMVEGNQSCQLARLIRQECGYHFKEAVTRYDGLPITARYILDRL